jgi:hypothetical protein
MRNLRARVDKLWTKLDPSVARFGGLRRHQDWAAAHASDPAETDPDYHDDDDDIGAVEQAFLEAGGTQDDWAEARIPIRAGQVTGDSYQANLIRLATEAATTSKGGVYAWRDLMRSWWPHGNAQGTQHVSYGPGPPEPEPEPFAAPFVPFPFN